MFDETHRDADPADPAGRGPAWYQGPVPIEHRAGPFTFVPLTIDLVEEDYAAVLASAEHLRWWSDSTWPTDDFSVAENLQDLVWHDEEHHDRVAFTYSVLDAAALTDGTRRVVGCLYIRPFTSACSTRGVACPTDLLDSEDAVARGWLIDDLAADRDDLATTVLSWLQSEAWQFGGAWWQDRITDTDAELNKPAGARVIGQWMFRRGGVRFE